MVLWTGAEGGIVGFGDGRTAATSRNTLSKANVDNESQENHHSEQGNDHPWRSLSERQWLRFFGKGVDRKNAHKRCVELLPAKADRCERCNCRKSKVMANGGDGGSRT